MKLNHRQRHALRYCLKEASYWTQVVTQQQHENGGVSHRITVECANLWRNRFMRYYFKLHPDA